MAKDTEKDERGDVLAMFDRIPVERLEAKAYELLDATRMVNLGRDREPAPEPDNNVRLRVWETIIAHRVGAPASRKPTEPAKDKAEDKPAPGQLIQPSKVKAQGQRK